MFSRMSLVSIEEKVQYIGSYDMSFTKEVVGVQRYCVIYKFFWRILRRMSLQKTGRDRSASIEVHVNFFFDNATYPRSFEEKVFENFSFQFLFVFPERKTLFAVQRETSLITF